MISLKSLEPLIWLYNFGGWLNLFPYYWNQNEGRLVLLETQPGMRKKYKFWKAFAIFNISSRICVIIVFLVTMKFGPNIQPQEILLLVFLVCILLMSVPVHLLYLFFGSRIVNHMNSLLQLNQDSGK